MKHFARYLLFPPVCAGCGDRFDLFVNDEVPALCLPCILKWEQAKGRDCPECGKAFSECVCAPEILKKMGIDKLFKLCEYRPHRKDLPEIRMILTLKDKRIPRAFQLLGQELAKRIRGDVAEEPVLVTFVPRGKTGKNRAGFDQGEELARAVAESGGWKEVTMFRRTGGTEQKTLSAAERRKNTEKNLKFSCGEEITGATVVLVDDVVTTGATMAACAEQLLRAGAGRVVPLAVAVTKEKSGSGGKTR